MSRRVHRHARLAWTALLALSVLVSCAWAAPAWASPDDEPPPPVGEATERGEPDTLDADALEKRLLDKPHTAAVTLLLRFLPALVGVALVILWYLKRDRIRGGVLPAPAPAEPTRPFGVWFTLLLALLGMVLVPFVVLGGLMGAYGWKVADDVPMWAKVVTTALGAVPIAILVVARRFTMGTSTASEAPPPPVSTGFLHPDRGAPGSPPPGPRRAFALGWWTLCVAGLIVLLVTLVWAVALNSLGVKPVVQDLVRQVIDPDTPSSVVWMIAFFGVVVAPFAEESIFRGLLYPAARRTFGGGRGGAWVAAAVVSLLFGAIHQSWYAFLPLFALAMILTYVFETTNSLAAVIVAHGLYNFFSLVPLFVLRFLP